MPDPVTAATRQATGSPGVLPPAFHLRPLSEDDAPAVAALAGRLGDADDVEAWRDKLRSVATTPMAVGLGVESDGGLVAYMIGHANGGAFGLSGEAAFVESLGVHPAWQGHGLARVLAEEMLDRFAAHGARRALTLVSPRDERLRPFFRSLGFRASQLLCLERRL